MRIVHVIDHFQPWMGYQETYVAREQAKQGHQVTVVTSDRLATVAGGDRKVQAGRETVDGVDVIRLPVRFELPTRAAYVWMTGLKETLMELQPDTVHCHGVLSFTAIRVARMKQRLGFSLLYDNHMADFNVYSAGKHSLKGRVQRAVYATLGFVETFSVLKQADTIVAIGEPERAFVRQLFGRRCPDVPIVRLGADSNHFTFRPDARASLREDYGWSDDDVVLGHAGTIRPSKRIDTLIRSAGTMYAAGHPVRVFIVGRIDAALKDELIAEVTRQGLRDRVDFQEFVSVDELPDYLSAMDIAVWPGDISNTAIEAMAVGLPVVAARTPYTASVVEEQGAGVLFEQGDDRNLAAALQPVVCDRDFQQALARQAREAVERELNWASIARQFVDLYASAPLGVPARKQATAAR